MYEALAVCFMGWALQGSYAPADVENLHEVPAERRSREYVAGLMKQARLDVRTDAAGNLFGRRAGAEDLPVLLFGSHIDSGTPPTAQRCFTGRCFCWTVG